MPIELGQAVPELQLQGSMSDDWLSGLARSVHWACVHSIEMLGCEILCEQCRLSDAVIRQFWVGSALRQFLPNR